MNLENPWVSKTNVFIFAKCIWRGKHIGEFGGNLGFSRNKQKCIQMFKDALIVILRGKFFNLHFYLLLVAMPSYMLAQHTICGTAQSYVKPLRKTFRFVYAQPPLVY